MEEQLCSNGINLQGISIRQQMTHFLKNGNTYKVFSQDSIDLSNDLPAGNYVIKLDPYDNMYLEKIENFEIKGKLYGDVGRNTDRILNTFEQRPNATGVMLSGEKGSGKTLLSKMISVEGAKLGYPTIIINSPWRGDQFNTLIQSIEQPAIILFDEFEKVYDKEEQEEILTLLDGVFPSKKLFVLTCNDKWRVDIHMRNRPGRIYYMLDFYGLDHDFIREYCADNLKAQEHTESVCKISSLFDEFNFDMLKALIEEMNRYNESPQESIRMLNAKPEYGDKGNFHVNVEINGVMLDNTRLHEKEWEGNPLTSKINFYVATHKDKDGDWDWNYVRFGPQDLLNVDADNRSFTFVNASNQKLELVRVKEKKFDYYSAF
jgi:hypothetical protein